MRTQKHTRLYIYIRILAITLALILAVLGFEYLYKRYFLTSPVKTLSLSPEPSNEGYDYEKLFFLFKKYQRFYQVYAENFTEFAAQGENKEQLTQLLNELEDSKKSYGIFFYNIVDSYKEQGKEIPSRVKRRLHHYQRIIDFRISDIKKMIKRFDDCQRAMAEAYNK